MQRQRFDVVRVGQDRQRAPREPRSGIFTRPVVVLMMVGGIWSMIVNLALFIWAVGCAVQMSC